MKKRKHTWVNMQELLKKTNVLINRLTEIEMFTQTCSHKHTLNAEGTNTYWDWMQYLQVHGL